MAAQAAAAETLGRVAGAGGALVAAAYYSLFNVEGGKRAIVFNRVVGVKNEVRAAHGTWTKLAEASPKPPEAALPGTGNSNDIGSPPLYPGPRADASRSRAATPT